MAYFDRIDSPQKINLSKVDPVQHGKAEKDDAILETTRLSQELSSLQEMLYAAASHSVLIVLQGMDTSGKDGTISHVFSFVNPQGCDVASFKIPTVEDLAHDFLWRVHKQTPAKGQIVIFNRSHYEDVLVARVHKLVSKEVLAERYGLIERFEEMLADNSTIIMKFFLHISNDVQEERLLAREKDPLKSWKLSTGDWKERAYWDDYVTAYQDALEKTSTKRAPWYIIPANKKWYRNIAIATAIAETLRPYKSGWQKTLEDMGKQRKSELDAMRADGEAPAVAASHVPKKK